MNILDQITGRDKLKHARELRLELLEEYKGLTATAGKRHLSDSERGRADRVAEDIETLDPFIKELELKERKGKMSVQNKFNEDSGSDEPLFTFDGHEDGPQILKKTKADPRNPISDWVLRNYSVPEDAQGANVFDVIAGLAGKKKLSKATEAAMATVKSVSGTATLTEHLSAQMWESGIARSHLGKSGMQIFMMDEPTVRFARISEFPALEWKAQLAATTERTVTFDSVDSTAATLRGFASASAELLADGHGVRKGIDRAFSVSLGTEIDRAGLYGSGSGEEPLGIRNYIGVPTYEHDDQLTDYDPFLEAQKLVWDENGPDHDTAIMAPDALIQLAKLKGTEEFQPVMPPKLLSNWRFLQTSKTPQDEGTPENQSSIVQGGFSSLHLGIRLNTTIMVTPIQADTFSYSILGAFRGQFFCERISDLAVITKIHRDPVT